MSHKDAWSALIAAVVGALCSYALELAVPIAVLIGVMVLDWITGMAKAFTRRELSSRVGLAGLLKKVGYLVVVCVAGVIDYLARAALGDIGVTAELPYLFGMVVTVWLIVNELISILENVAALGVPVPGFVLKMLARLKSTAEQQGDAAAEQLPEEEDHAEGP